MVISDVLVRIVTYLVGTRSTILSMLILLNKVWGKASNKIFLRIFSSFHKPEFLTSWVKVLILMLNWSVNKQR